MGVLQTKKMNNTLIKKGNLHKLVKYWTDFLRLLKTYGIFETVEMVLEELVT